MHRSKILAGLAFVPALLSCSRPANHNPSAVNNPRAVQAIIVASGASTLDTCEREIRAAGAQVIYRNDRGLLMADKPPAKLGLHHCEATVSANQSVALTANPASVTADLSQVLKLLPAEEMGARSFVKAYPAYDGRGVVVAILDTGVELDHPMLKKTSSGEDKIVDFQDFSGEGTVALTAVTPASDGVISLGGDRYSIENISGDAFAVGVFAGTSLNNKGEDTVRLKEYIDLGLLVYRGADGNWKSRLDVDGDKSFENDVELENFSISHKFVKIGSRKLLAVAVNVADDGKTASLVFDDGAHGTHVAGISAGYDPNGLQGVAPGAQIMSLKIGDNRLNGGSTTTASMMLAIDYAAAHGARIANMSYGVRGGSNVGASVIDLYVDKIARETGLIFSISAGNEGPGTLTVGIPAGAHLAITNGAYLSKETARANYGYLGVQNDNSWFFSSVGPLLDGGWKPTLLSPGSAVSSVPLWSGGYANYRGTSMASPETTGALALLVSAGLHEKLPVDRVSITQSVYASAKPVAGLSLIEQGHGLLNVPAALAELRTRKAAFPIEYDLSVNSPTAPGGVGDGIYVRARELPANPFTVKFTPQFPVSATPDQMTALRQLTLRASASWIRTPGTTWSGAATNSFQVQLDPAVLLKPGLHSELISAVDNATGKVAFEVPVTVSAPTVLNDGNSHLFTEAPQLAVGQTLRYFIDVPAGTTALSINASSNGPAFWGQLLDVEGRKVLTLDDTERTSPQNPLSGSAKITRAGVYELDLVGPPTNGKAAQLQVRAQAYSLTVTNDAAETNGAFELTVQNNFEPVKLRSVVEVRSVRRSQVYNVTGDAQKVPFSISSDDLKNFQSIRFTVTTAKTFYDQMTDYPYLILDADGKVLTSGGLELQTEIAFDDLDTRKAGDYSLQVQGAFARAAPDKWAFRLEETRVLDFAVATADPTKLSLETGQFQTLSVKPPDDLPPVPAGFRVCATIALQSADGKQAVQETTLCP